MTGLPMMDLVMDQAQLGMLKRSLVGRADLLPREIRAVINSVAKKVALEAARDLSKVLPLKIRTLKKICKQTTKPTKSQLGSTVLLGEGFPIPLSHFSPKQTESGVSVTMQRTARVRRKNSAGDTFLPGAFVVKQWGNSIAKRVGKARYPIAKQYGPKPGDFFAELNLVAKSVDLAKERLAEEMERRIKFNILKNQGVIKR